MNSSPRISVVATSSAVPQVEFAMGVAHLRAAGMIVDIQPNCAAQAFVFAGDDRQRADCFYAAATSTENDALWCACGGYGSARILPLLDRLTLDRGVPPLKSLLGFSDATAVMSYARQRWGWRTTHAPMVISRGLRALNAATLQALAQGLPPPQPWGHWPLRWLNSPPPDPLEANLIGGNLSVWNSFTGTPFAESAAGKILFLEDVDEAPYRIDRLITQLQLSGRLDGVAAIVLGGFTDCQDRVSQVLSAHDPHQRVPLRQSFTIDEALAWTFGRLKIPVAAGLPVGHGALFTPLPLGVKYRLNSNAMPILRYSQEPDSRAEHQRPISFFAPSTRRSHWNAGPGSCLFV
jgi:muramoyltetrapeptide carboxypeptidase